MTPKESLLRTYGMMPEAQKSLFIHNYLSCSTIEDYLKFREKLKQFLDSKEQDNSPQVVSQKLDAAFYIEIVEHRIKAMSAADPKLLIPLPSWSIGPVTKAAFHVVFNACVFLMCLWVFLNAVQTLKNLLQ